MLTFWNKNVQLFQIITPDGNFKRYAARKKILQEDNFNSSIIKGKKVNRPCQTSLVSVSNFEKNKDFLMDFLFQYTDRREGKEDERKIVYFWLLLGMQIEDFSNTSFLICWHKMEITVSSQKNVDKGSNEKKGEGIKM